MSAHNDRTIGLIINNLDGQYSYDFWQQMSGVCQREGYKLVTISGKSISDTYDYSYQHEWLYYYLKEACFDGIIVLGTTFDKHVDSEDPCIYGLDGREVPIIQVGDAVPHAISSVVIDQTAGTKDGVSHMIEKHGSQRLAFISGKAGHSDGEARYKGYCQALLAHNIGIDQQLVFRGDYLMQSGEDAVAYLFGQGGVGCDTIIAANDDMAIGALAALKRLNIVVPDQVKVVGFDNIPDLRFYMSPLATVNQPLKEVAEMTVRLWQRHWAGERIEARLSVKTSFVPRLSCGCNMTEHIIGSVLVKGLGDIESYVMTSQLDRIFVWEKIQGLVVQLEGQPVSDAWMNRILIEYEDWVDMFENPYVEGLSKEMVQVLILLRHYLLNRPLPSGNAKQIEALINQMIEYTNKRLFTVNDFSEILNRRKIEPLYKEGFHQILNATSLNDFKNIFYTVLSKMSVDFCYLMLLNNPRHHNEGDLFDFAQSGSLFIALKDGKRVKEVEGDMPISEFMQHNVSRLKAGTSAVLTPLYFKSEVYGVLLYDMPTVRGSSHISFRKQISTAIRYIYAIKQADEKNRSLREQIDINTKLKGELEGNLAELKLRHEQLIETEKMSALGVLVSGVAHELNTPIGISVSGGSYLLQKINRTKDAFEMGKLSKKVFEEHLQLLEETGEIIELNLERAAKLNNSFKNIAADSVSEAQRLVQIKGYIEEVLTSLKPKYKRRQITINLQCDPHLRVTTWPGVISQIIINLVDNAMLHAYKDSDHGQILIKVTKDVKWLKILFQDDGCGMTTEVLSKVFDPFYTTKRGKGGTGLGLNIVYRLVTEKLKGHIDCISSPSGGTEFYMKIPVL